MDPRRGPAAADSIADHPAHRVTGCDRSRADQLFTFLQRNVGDLAGLGIDLIKRAFGVGKDLDRVDEPGALGLHPSSLHCRSQPVLESGATLERAGAARSVGRGTLRKLFELAGERKRHGDRDHLLG